MSVIKVTWACYPYPSDHLPFLFFPQSRSSLFPFARWMRRRYACIRKCGFCRRWAIPRQAFEGIGRYVQALAGRSRACQYSIGISCAYVVYNANDSVLDSRNGTSAASQPVVSQTSWSKAANFSQVSARLFPAEFQC